MTPPTSRDHEKPERRKAMFYCWECDHADPIEGDWIRDGRGQSVAYVCPDCNTVIAERPKDDDSGRGPRPTAAWSRVVRTSVSVWRASFGAGMAAVTATTRDRSDDY
ncbi:MULTISPECIES: phage terminase large subunit family protein [Natrialbaceae]|uniref:phage terminase large subunit family protein n=1 Tax=Natrialbaceae TaxID=1644061 RepID=UPI00207C2ED6|nr:phage terminase large subunit family protein [Natronococcus sp. CG52]